MAEVWDSTVLERPNWNDHIQHFFEEPDITCMDPQGIDLTTYYGVRLNADRIYFHTQRGSMPPPELNRRWSDQKIENFYRWMWAGYPEGEHNHHIWELNQSSPPRVRRSIQEYEDDDEALELLRKAFQGMIDKDIQDPSSYFRIAAIHWLPAPAMYCRHHENAYNPWHRAYLLAFEDAMRQIDGCHDITLPYWDIQSDRIPDFLWEQPFGEYVFPTDVHHHSGAILASAGDVTTRQSKQGLLDRVRERSDRPIGGRKIDDYIRLALAGPRWQMFNGWSSHSDHSGIIRAHDMGHGLCGTDDRSPTNRSIARPNFAAFDPFFWFFHCNWDRLWWQWQIDHSAADVESFKHRAESEDDPTDWVDDPVVSMLQPFGTTVDKVIDARYWGLEYSPPATVVRDQPTPPVIVGNGRALAHERAVVAQTNTLSVRVKGVNRLVLPGSFYLELLANGVPIAETYVFQSDTPQFCRSCTATGQFSADFIIEASDIEGRRLDVRARCFTLGGEKVFPSQDIGDPSLNVRVLLN